MRERSRRPVEEDKKKPPVLSLKPADLHPVVAAAMPEYVMAKPLSDGTYGEHYPTDLKLRVSPANLERALRLADTLFKAAEKRGYKIGSKEGKEGKGPYILVDGQAVRVVVKEKLIQAKAPEGTWPRRTFTPTGKLMIVVGDSYGSKGQVSDSTRWKVEARIEAALDRVSEEARREKDKRIREEEWHRKREEERRIEQEALARREEEKRKREAFLAQIGPWRTAKDIRAFVEDVRKAAAASGKLIEPGTALGQTLDWAMVYADQIDPVQDLVRESPGSHE